MSSTHSGLFVHAVFAVKYRNAVLEKGWRGDVYKYMAGILKRHNHHPILINGVEDHVHLLYGAPPNIDSSKMMQLLKANSSKWINEQKLTTKKFQWQRGFGVYSTCISQLQNTKEYIANQEERHKKTTFLDEYRSILDLFGIEIDERDLFKPLQ